MKLGLGLGLGFGRWASDSAPPAPPAPPAPTLATMTLKTNAGFTLGWTAGSGADSYTVQIATDSGYSVGVVEYTGIAATTKAVTGRAENSTWYARVKAVNTGGESAWLNYGTPTAITTFYTDAQTYFAAIVSNGGTAATDDRKEIANTLIGSLKTAGVWAKLDALFLVGADAVASRLNWITPATLATAVNAPTFTANKGYAGAGSGAKYVDTGINLSSGVSKYLYNNASMFVWLLSAQSVTMAIAGSRLAATGGNDQSNVVSQITTSARCSLWSRNTALPAAASLTPAGLVGGSLLSGTNTLSLNGLQIDTSEQAANIANTQALNGNAFMLTANANGSAAGATYPGIMPVMGFGTALTMSTNAGDSTEYKSLYTALNTYLTAIGAFA